MRHIHETLHRARPAFRDRREAGVALADYLEQEGASPGMVMAVPAGGVAVACPVAQHFRVPLDVVLVRKLPYPFAPESGFGAVSLAGQMVMDEAAAARAGLSRQRIEGVKERVLEGLRARAQRFQHVRSTADPEGMDILLVDDGLATGSTMLAAVSEVRRRGAAAVSVAVPDAPEDTVERVEPAVDRLYCLFVQTGKPFAVASFYRRWRDLSDREAVELLRSTLEQADGDSP
jgi:predicted phosphoribosyltransferase